MSVTVSTIHYSNAYHSIIITIFIIIRMYLPTTVITMLMIPMQQALSRVYVIKLINEYAYENGVQFEIKSL